MERLQDTARAQLEGAAGAELPAARRAVEQAAFVQLSACPALCSGQERLAALEAVVAAERQARRASLGLQSVETPHEYFCPITLALMRDPVVVSDGHSYERASIEEVLRVSGVSPRTREPLDPKIVVPNRALRTRIEEHDAEQEAMVLLSRAHLLESQRKGHAGRLFDRRAVRVCE
jgi:hypothetical protein